MKISKEFVYAILSGFMIGTTYIPFPPWALFFCLAPLWSQVLKQTSYKKVFWMGWTTQFLLALIGFHWIPYTIVEFGHLPYFVGALGLFAFAAFTNLHIPLGSVLWLYLKKKGWLKPGLSEILALAILTALLERINPQIFPWHMGYPWMYGGFPAYQTADIWGFTGLSALSYILNGWILYILINLKDKKILRAHTSYFIIFFSLINVWGYYQKSKWDSFDTQIKILSVQPNIGNQEKQFEIFGSSFKNKVLDTHFDLTHKALQENQVDLIIWPETSIPEYLDNYFYRQANVQRVLDFIRQNKTPVLAGAYSHNLRTFQDSNSLFLFDENAQQLGLYKKYQLLAFGEYLPFSDYFPSLLKLLPTIANFERGVGPSLLYLKDVKIGAQICYEGLHPWFTNELAIQGADILVNVTNDSWFGHTFEPAQHLFMTLARSIEVRRPMVRTTNTGISSAILANGDIIGFSPQKVPWTGVFNLEYKKLASTTFFTVFPYLDVLFCGLGLISLILRSRKK